MQIFRTILGTLRTVQVTGYISAQGIVVAHEGDRATVDAGGHLVSGWLVR